MGCAVVPLGDRIVIAPCEAEHQTPGGLVIPDVAKDKPTRGKITAVGPGRLLDNGERVPMDVHEGDVVLYPTYAGSTITVDGEELVVMKREELLAKLEAV